MAHALQIVSIYVLSKSITDGLCLAHRLYANLSETLSLFAHASHSASMLASSITIAVGVISCLTVNIHVLSITIVDGPCLAHCLHAHSCVLCESQSYQNDVV